MKKSVKKENVEKTTMMEGVMTFGKTGNGQHMLDFMCTEYVEITPFIADCKVQAMHDGNVYITERPKRIHNTPLYVVCNGTGNMLYSGNDTTQVTTAIAKMTR